jgi:apolipoprotein N-acyltransferase
LSSPGATASAPAGAARPLAGRVAAAVAGAALPLAFAPFGFYPVAILSLAILFHAWRAPPREAAWRGFAFGVGAFAAGTWWLYVSVRLVGGTPLPVAVLLLGGLVAIMAAWIAAAGWLAARLARRSLAASALLAMPGAWVLAEWLRGWVLTGFPWLSVGYGQIDGPLAGWAPVAGVYGISLVAALLSGALLLVVAGTTRERGLAAAVALAVAAATAALGAQRWIEPAGEPLRVALVQGAVPQLLKWAPGERRATMELYWSMTETLEGRDLVVWPEAAIPAPDDMVGDYLDGLRALARERGMQLLVGILTHDAETDEYRNSLLALGEPAGAYHKRHLVPFGEFFPVPAFVRSWMRMMSLPYSDIARGSDRQAPLAARGVALAPTICYEDAYGAEQLVFQPAAGVLVNVSNDAWFGDTLAPHQHLQIARMRALETGRPMARTTNTGITALIDERGAVVATIPQFRPAVLEGEVQPFGGSTPYARTGNVPVLAVAVALLVAAGLAGRRRGPAGP